MRYFQKCKKIIHFSVYFFYIFKMTTQIWQEGPDWPEYREVCQCEVAEGEYESD